MLEKRATAQQSGIVADDLRCGNAANTRLHLRPGSFLQACPQQFIQDGSDRFLLLLIFSLLQLVQLYQLIPSDVCTPLVNRLDVLPLLVQLLQRPQPLGKVTQLHQLVADLLKFARLLQITQSQKAFPKHLQSGVYRLNHRPVSV